MTEYRNPFMPKPPAPPPLADAARERMIRNTIRAGQGQSPSGTASPRTTPPAQPVVNANTSRDRMIRDMILRSR